MSEQSFEEMEVGLVREEESAGGGAVETEEQIVAMVTAIVEERVQEAERAAARSREPSETTYYPSILRRNWSPVDVGQEVNLYSPPVQNQPSVSFHPSALRNRPSSSRASVTYHSSPFQNASLSLQANAASDHLDAARRRRFEELRRSRGMARWPGAPPPPPPSYFSRLLTFLKRNVRELVSLGLGATIIVLWARLKM